MAACFRLMSPLEIQEQEEKEEQQQKVCLMVMADPSDLGHGKNTIENVTQTVFERQFTQGYQK